MIRAIGRGSPEGSSMPLSTTIPRRPLFAAESLKRFVPDLRDARYFQMFGQALILAIGLFAREFQISALQMAAVAATCLAAQWFGSFLNAIRFDWKSAAITALSLSLLLRSDQLWPLMAAAAIGIGSKFAIRRQGGHIFNPANLGIVVMLLATDVVWTSTGEWGSALWYAALIAALGALSTWRARRLDVPLVFLGVYGGLLLVRALYLGDPLAIPALRLTNAALILFAFFMISDPKTTPEDPRRRALFVALAAALAYVMQFHFFNSDGIFIAPFIVALVALAIPQKNGADRFEWGAPPRFWFRTPVRAPAE
ncbi:MAG: RnfABCDGE type electron transport complex subunit D [Parvularculaceae bacterium]